MSLTNKAFFTVFCLVLLSVPVFAEIEIGDTVVAYWQDDGMYYFGTAVEYNTNVKGGAYLIIYQDGTQALVPSALVVEYELEVGAKVYAQWSGGGSYPGKVAKIVGNAVYVHYDDGDKGWTSMGCIALEDSIVNK